MTAGLTGFLAPLLFRHIDHVKSEQKKIFEADIARQGKIIDAQVKLLEDLAGLLWEYQLLLIAVPYYKQFESRGLYEPALKADNIIDNLATELSLKATDFIKK